MPSEKEPKSFLEAFFILSKKKPLEERVNEVHNLITLLRIPYLGRIGSTKLVLRKWHKYGILNRVIRVR